MNKKNLLRAALAALIFIVGFFSGMEYKAYQIRSALTEGLKGITGMMDGKTTINQKTEDPIAANKLREKVDLTITSKKFDPANIENTQYQNYITMGFKFSNKTAKDIRGVEGTVIFYDIFQNEIKRVNISYDDTPIAANTDKTWVASIKYNQFMDSDIKLNNTELENLKYVWLPSTIIYQDGSSDKE
jgi:hypothetical protein